jgi:ABC-2 type transport system permease protein
MGGLRLYFRYAVTSIRAQVQYRTSFVMFASGHFLATGLEFIGVWALFDRFGNLRGWSLPEVALLYGMVSVSFALAEGFARGFDTFDSYIKTGDFDRILVRPRSAVTQVIGRELQLMRVGRLAQGLAVLMWSSQALDVSWTALRVLLLVAAILGGACLFCGLLVLQATLAFWTTESLEVMNTVTYGGVESAQFPIAVYRRWFRWFLIYAVPLATVNYFPSNAILGRVDAMGFPAWVGWGSPLVGVAFLLGACQVWRIGVRRYTSVGS